MAAPIVGTIVRGVLNPRAFMRFLGTKSGKRATLKFGRMLLKSKMAGDLVARFIGRNGKQLDNNREYKQQVREYEKLQKRIASLESKLDRYQNNSEKIQELTFTLGRCVVEMNQLLAQMQELYRQQTQQMQIAMANTRTR